MIRPLVIILFGSIFSVSGQNTKVNIGDHQISFTVGQVVHFSRVISSNGDTKSPPSASTFIDLNYTKSLLQRHELSTGLIFSNYKFRYTTTYANGSPEAATFSSIETGSRSGYIKFYLMYGYNIYNKPRLSISLLCGPTFNLQGKTRVWGKSSTEIIDSTDTQVSTTLIRDSVLKVSNYGFGVMTGLNCHYKVVSNTDLYLNLKVSYNHGFNRLYEIYTETTTNKIVYDKSMIRGNGTGIFTSLGIAYNF